MIGSPAAGRRALDPVGSTSWRNRHLAAFRRLNDLLRQAGVARPTVMIIGPGGVTRLAGWLLNDAEDAQASRIRKLVGDAARYSDQLLRRIPLLPLRSLEPLELGQALAMAHRLVVVDCSQRILSAVAGQLPSATCHCLDIQRGPPPETADVVVAFNVICRLERPEAGMANVVKALRPGGWLLMDDRSAEAQLAGWPQLSPVAPKTYRRESADDR